NYLRGQNILMSHNVNMLTASGRPNPSFANISQYDSIGDSWFNAVTASLETRGLPWGRVRLSLTLSKSEDDAGNAFFQTPQTHNEVLADKGPSDNDQRRRLVVSGTLGDGSSARLRRAMAGFQVGWVYQYSSAVPFNIVTGADNNGDGTFNDRPAGVGRNAGRMPWVSELTQTCGASSFDVRVSRAIVFRTQRIELMLEGFKLLNRSSATNVTSTMGSGATPSLTFKQVTSVGDMRQFQLGVRWSF